MEGSWTLQGYDWFQGGSEAFFPLNDNKYDTEPLAREAAQKLNEAGVSTIFIVSPTGVKTQVF